MEHRQLQLMKFKRLFLCLLLPIYIIFSSELVLANNSIFHLSIHFKGNLIFDKYNVELYLDQNLLTTLRHGEEYKGTFEQDNDYYIGRHTIFLCKEGDPSIFVEETVNLTQESTFSCEIRVSKKNIQLSKVTVIDNAAEKELQAKESLAAESSKVAAEEESKAQAEKERKAAASKAAEESRIQEEQKLMQQSVQDVLSITNPDDPQLESFSKKFHDNLFSLDGYIAYISTRNGTNTYLIRSGSYKQGSSNGPDFVFTQADAKFENDPSLELKRGMNISLSAKALSYDQKRFCFQISPETVLWKSTATVKALTQNDFKSKKTIQSIQQALNEKGYDCGTADGIAGKRTNAAVSQYRKNYGIGDSNVIDEELSTYLNVKVEHIPETTKAPEIIKPSVATKVITETEPPKRADSGTDYVLNKNTGKFHYTWCSSVNQMKAKNRKDYHGTREEVIGMGYVPCKRCNP